MRELGQWAGHSHRFSPPAVPAPPSDLSLSPLGQSPALRASWTPPPGGRDGFRLQLYRLRPLSLQSTGTLAPEARNFSWASLPPGAEFRLLLVTLRGPDQSRSANASAWTRECRATALLAGRGAARPPRLFATCGQAAGLAAAAPRPLGGGRPAPHTRVPRPGPLGLVFACPCPSFLKDTGPTDDLVPPQCPL